MKPLASAKPNTPDVKVSWDCFRERRYNTTTFVHSLTSKTYNFNKKQCLMSFMSVVAKITLLNVKEACQHGGNLY